jgi:mRNA-degrading endonuclease toxin of MazEF toxin-antitoxin module
MKKTRRAVVLSNLLVAEQGGDVLGVGTEAELRALVAEGVLPADTTLRPATLDDL